MEQIKSKLSKKALLEQISFFKQQTDETFLSFCNSHGDDHSITKHVFERCRTLNELINRISPTPKKTGCKKRGASKILKNINK